MELIKSGNNSDKYEEYEALLLERDQVSKESDQIMKILKKMEKGLERELE